MSDKTKIEWTDATWNPLVGCSRVSAGCINCYAERHAYRFARQAGTVYEGTARLVNGKPTFTGRVNLNERVLDAPLRWKAPRRIFVNSMSDLFHESVPDETIDSIFAVMALAPQHTFQILTKRPARMRAYFARELLAESWWEAGDRMACEIRMSEFHPGDVYLNAGKGKTPVPLPNVWLGVSVEDQAAADERIPLLLKTPAAVRFLSCEPLLGPVDLTRIARSRVGINDVWTNSLTGEHANENPIFFGKYIGSRIDWVIAGGESGPRARPMHSDWAYSLRDQCAAANVPFFFKQWGEWAPIFDIANSDAFYDKLPALYPESTRRYRVETTVMHLNGECFDHAAAGAYAQGSGSMVHMRIGKHAAGRLINGVEHNAYPVGA